MVDRTLPTLTATSSLADNTLFLVRRNGQTEDEKTTGADLKTFLYSSTAITGGTINNTVIGNTTPAAGSFTTLTANTIDTGQGAVECYAMNQAVTTGSTVAFSALSLTTDLAVTHGGTGASTAADARTNLGVGTAGTRADAYFLQTANNLSDLNNATTARTNLGLGSLATLNTINNGNWSGDDLDVANGGTGASTAANARDNLGLTIGTNVQAQNAALQSIAGLTTAADRMIYTTASNVYAVATLTSFGRSLIDDTNATNARTTLGLGTIATQAASNVTITGGSIAGITDLAIADGGTGAGTAGGARTNLGLGSIATQDANNVSISGGSVTGIADIAIADGGTGASTAAAARTNLDVYSKSETNALIQITKSYDSGDQTITAGGNLNLAHGLGAVPKLTTFILKCTTADGNYSVGDEVIASSLTYDTSTNRGFAAVIDGTNYYIRFGSTNPTFTIYNKTTGAIFNIVNSSWAFIIRGYA